MVNKYFFELIQIAIGNRDNMTRVPSKKEWLEIYQMAKKQSMIGIVFCGIEKIVEQNKTEVLGPPMGHGSMPVPFFMDWMGQREKVKIKNEEADEDCEIIRKHFAENGFRTAIMKGQGNAGLYKSPLIEASSGDLDEHESHGLHGSEENIENINKNIKNTSDNCVANATSFDDPISACERDSQTEIQSSSSVINDDSQLSEAKNHSCTSLRKTDEASLSFYRTPGDIDLWVEGGFEKVYEFVKKNVPEAKFTEKEIYYNIITKTPVEVHHCPIIIRNPITNKRLQRFLQTEAENCFESETGFTTIRFNIIHQLAHIHLHLFTEGIGFRQLMDYYFVLLHSREDKNEMMEVVRSLGMENFAKAVMWIMHDILGLDEAHLLCEPNKKDGEFLLKEILKSGNFGKSDDELQEKKKGVKGSIWLFMFRNLRYWRFDHWDWFWAPAWRVYHKVWKKVKGGW